MATPSELSLQEIRQYLLDNGGTVRNRDLVKHFKRFLTDPETRVEARNNFKEYVNILASIKNEAGEKYLVLKKKYREGYDDVPSPVFGQLGQGSPLGTPDVSCPTSPLRDPPPYRPPPPAPLSPSCDNAALPISPLTRVERSDRFGESTNTSWSNVQEPMCESGDGYSREPMEPVEAAAAALASPPVPPRRKSQDKFKFDNKENATVDRNRNGHEAVIKEDESSGTTTLPATTGSAELLSVRERMQRFNRMASETDLPGKANGVTTTPTKKRSDKGTDEDDRASVASQLDGKSREWLVRAAQGDYQALAKLAAEEPRLTRLKYTALHWGAKHGDENIVKLIAGTYKDYIKGVNEMTNGGYTPLHIAMQFDHENIFNLLVQVYGANQEVRDHSGKKARQYLVSQEAAVSQDTFRKIKARKKHTERDLGFLRIGSLNVRVKRTTEAFSQFLGVATSASSNEKIHKTWGSADNVQDGKNMPPPKYAPIKKRRSRRAQDFGGSGGGRGLQTHATSQPSTPLPQARENLGARRPSSTSSVAPAMGLGPSTIVRQNDSDSDGACGFDSAWRGSAQI
ncbi:ankyrin repeat domain-containing protein SOWAHB isoform X2 [Venturia canescens]|uniref:ankyrin repeat domain-containing protein SOWAHB isoform X2 n=1 Tax=Venturia canescens TaxID=32260 RepID=UPI001C9C0D5C|nr:ankyrin repeat domain-containing protein SOWAHB isoform X2 [Venturia canescens]